MSDQEQQEAKRRKVRKGTHSCWECRRRKVRCQFDTSDDTVCIGCKTRGSTCKSQEFDDDGVLEPGQKPEPALTRRLDRLEHMMERLVDRIAPEPPRRMTRSISPWMQEARDSSIDVLDAATSSDGPVAALLAMRNNNASTLLQPPTEPAPMMTPESGPGTASTAATRELPPPKHFWVCTVLRSVLPSQAIVDAIVSSSPGAPYVATMFQSSADALDGKGETPANLAVIPPVSSHPLILAKRVIQLLICIQLLPPSFSWEGLGLEISVLDMMHRMVTTSTLVTSNDELVGYSEGLECLLLQGYYQANAGNLRKAWISFRRAMCLGQLMGIDRGQKRAFRSCNPQTPPQERPTAEFLWYRIINSDRYLSLLLGLQHGTDDNSFLYSVAHSRDTPMERLEKIHTYLSAKIIERNQAKGKRAYSLTQEICYELDEAAKTMGESWWEIPKMDPFDKPGEIYEYTAQMILQIHHSTMLVLLHLPYMLREPNESRYDFNKCTAMKACQDVLKRFIVFRSLNVSAFSCRRVDYAALIATMTLLLGYLRRRKAEPTGPLYEKRCREDRELVEKTRKRMEHIQNLNKDKLSGESCEIIKQMLPIIIKAGTEEVVSLEQGPAGWDDGVHLNVPFLGTINVSKADPAGASSSVDPRCIDIDPTALAFCSDISFSAPSLLASADGTMQPNAPVNNEGDLLAPDVAAEGYEWAFQGVDTAFWSLLNESVGLDG